MSESRDKTSDVAETPESGIGKYDQSSVVCRSVPNPVSTRLRREAS